MPTPSVGGPSSCDEAAAKRKPDRAKPQVKRCTALNWAA